MISVKNLIKIYGSGENELVVLKGLEFEVAKGEFLSITGRSGSGKSTLLYQLGLLDMPNGGEIIIDGIDILKLSQDQRTEFRLLKLGYIFQDYALLPELTAHENVAVPLIMMGLSKKDAEEKAKESLRRVGLGERLYNTPSQLSGGQQQLVSIARAISHNPMILFADEPTANLDTETGEVVLQAFEELHKGGQTIVMITHELDFAKRADRTITLSDGKIISIQSNTHGTI